MTKNIDTPCPLCGSSKNTFIETVDYDAIWKHLKIDWEAIFSDSVMNQHTPDKAADLKECTECNLQFFSPAISGSEAFYAELTSSSPSYYCEDKWEFEFVRGILDRNDTILDIACGSGAFIQSATGLVSSVYGIDSNAHAVKTAVTKGLPVQEALVEVFSENHSEEFDVVTAFQVIEHLDSILPFVKAAYQCVKPGGYLVLSVPNRERRTRDNFEALDHPPHHLSRWNEEQFRVLAEKLDAHVIRMIKQPMSSDEIIRALRVKELPSILPQHFYGRQSMIKILSRMLVTFPMSALFHSKAMRENLSLYGMSLVALIGKPR